MGSLKTVLIPVKVFRILEDRDRNGTRECILISKTLYGQTDLHLLGSEERGAGIGTILMKQILVTYNGSRDTKTHKCVVTR